MANTGNNQSWLDVVIQTTGSLENLFLFAIANDISITGAPPTGTPYTLPDTVTKNTLVLGNLAGTAIGTNGN